MNRPEARAMNLQFLHDLGTRHARLRSKARALYRRVHELEEEYEVARKVNAQRKLASISRELGPLKRDAARAYGKHKEMERKLLALWEKFYQRFPVGPKPSPLAVSLDLKREAYRETWFDPCYPDTDPDSVTYICPVCQSQSTSGYQVAPVCMNELCFREGMTMETMETYIDTRYVYERVTLTDEEGNEHHEWRYKVHYELVKLKDGTFTVIRHPVVNAETQAMQEFYRGLAGEQRTQQEEDRHNAQADLENLRRYKREGRLFKRLQQYRNVSETEPESVAA